MATGYADLLARRRAAASDPERIAALTTERRAQALLTLRMDDLLTGEPWTVFASHLAALRAHYQTTATALETQILGDAVGDALMRLKLQASYARGFGAALELIGALPQTLQAQAAGLEARLAQLLDTSPAA